MPVKRIPFAVTIDSRDGTLTKDSKMVNSVPEKDGTMVNLNKRPGLLSVGTVATGFTTGMSAWRQWVFFAKGHHLYKYDIASQVVTDFGSILNTSGYVGFVRTYQDKHLFITDGVSFYDTTDGITINPVTDPSTSHTWRGAVWLNNYVYAANTTDNLIYSCHSGDPTTWTSTSNIAFYMTTDYLVTIAKHLNYIVAFGYKSMQFYYDAGTGDGSTISSLATSGSYTAEIGCASAGSVASAENTVIWAGWSEATGKSVYMLNGVSPVKISTPAVDKVLEANTISNGFIHQFSGHVMYVLQCGNITLAYDMTTQMWGQWTQVVGGVEGTFVPNQYTYNQFAFGSGNNSFLMGSDTNIYTLSSSTYQDNGQPIMVRSLSELDDEDNTLMKFVRRAEVIGDTMSTTINLSYTTNDYQTFSTPRVIDMSQTRPAVYQLANGRRRAWLMNHNDNTGLRLEALEVEYDVGS